MDCTRCHTPLPDGSKFCFACGADQTGGGTAVAAPSEVETLQLRLQRATQGKYEIKRLLGKGGMGAVFLAQDLTLDREVAIKVLPPEVSQDANLVKRFQQEAKTAAKLDHTNIIPIYRVESESGLNYFVMKYIAGTSLEDVVDEKKQLPVDYIQRVMWEAACALGHAHQRGIVHRDVKPANIMFDHDGKVMLTDFGISKALQAASGFTGTGMIIGTPHYMAPEQAKGQTVDGRADQYSLGVVGYRLLTGQLPFSGDSVHTILYKHIFEEPAPARDVRQDIPEFLAVAVQRAMAKDPAQRYATMEDFATAVWPEQPVTATLRGAPAVTRPRPGPAVSAELPTERFTTPPTPVPTATKRPVARPEAPPKKSRVGLVIGAVVVLGGAGAAGVLLTMGGGSTSGTGDTTAAVTPPAPAPAAPAAPATPIASDVRITPATATLRPGATTTLAATPVDAQGQTVAAGPVVWSSSAPRIARVDSGGRVTGVAPGLAMIEARAGAVRGQAAIQVAAPATAQQPPQTPPQAPPAQQQAPPAAEFGFLSINADPAATVFINGVNVGETPIANYRVRAGTVSIRVEAPGYRVITERVQIEPGATVPKRYSLTPEG
jgi:serine/threonine-protein kinase